MLKVGVVSTDRVDEWRAQHYLSVENVQLVGLVDKTGAQAAEYGVKSYSSVEELVKNEEVDVVDASFSQKDVVLKAASLGKHVICQNSLACSEEEAKEIITACEEAGVELWISNPLKFSPEYRKVQNLIEQGAIGKVGTVRIIKNIEQQEDSNGGILQTLLNEIEWLQSLFGDVKRVYAKGLKNKEIDVDVAYVSLRFENGIIAHLNINSIASDANERLFLEVAGEKGVISYDSSDVIPIHTTYYHSSGTRLSANDRATYTSDSALKEIKLIVQSIQSGEKKQSVEDYLHSLQCGLAVIESIKENKVITLADRRVSI